VFDEVRFAQLSTSEKLTYLREFIEALKASEAARRGDHPLDTANQTSDEPT
jgi:hypothetical protein